MIFHDKKHQRGFSLVELLIAVTLGLIVLIVFIATFVNNVQSRNEIERANQQTENGRYAMQLLTDDLRNAGYLAEFNPSVIAPTPSQIPAPCLADSTTDLATLTAALPFAVQGYDNGVGAPPCLRDVKAGTDIVVVRRASVCAVADTDCDPQVDGAPYFQASGCSGGLELGSSNFTNYYAFDTDVTRLNRHRKDCNPVTPGTGTLAPVHQYRVHIYFIANNDKTDDGIPTLKRAELGLRPSGDLGFGIVALVEGIEDLQIEYGLDNTVSTTGSPVVYTANPDSYNNCSATTIPPCAAYWRNAVAIKLHLLARNTTSTAGYRSNKTYYLGLQANGTAKINGPFTDSFKRHTYESVVRLNNTAGRNIP